MVRSVLGLRRRHHVLRTLLVIAYLAVGALVANAHNYLSGLGGWRAVASAVLAVVLWPLVLFGAGIHVT